MSALPTLLNLANVKEDCLEFGSAPEFRVGPRSRSAHSFDADRISPTLLNVSKNTRVWDPRPGFECVPESGRQPKGCRPEHRLLVDVFGFTKIALNSDPRPNSGWVPEIDRFVHTAGRDLSAPSHGIFRLLEFGIRAPDSSGSPCQVGND